MLSLEFTPNPNSLKFVTDRSFADGVYNFKTKPENEYIQNLFAVEGVTGVLVGKTFVTVSRTEESDIENVYNGVHSILERWLSGNHILSIPQTERGLSGLEKKIADFIEKDVRPAVEQDGGNIVFERFEDGVVYLSLEGACQSCPSSVATLKVGIERQLKKLVPEVSEVVSV